MNKKPARLASLVLAGSAALALAACSGTTPADSPATSGSGELDVLPIRLNWTFEAADHPWFFAGMEEGIYAEHGIELQPQEGTGSASTLQLVASGSDPVGLVDSGTMMGGVSKGLPVQAVCVLAQRNPMSAIFPASAGITGIDDLKGKTIAVTPGDSLSQIFPAVLAANDLQDSDVNMVGLADPAAKQSSVLTGASDAFLGYYTLQLPAIEQSSGEKMDYLAFSDLGVDTLSMGIVVNKDWAAENEDLLTRFIAATQESAQFVVDNPEKAADDFVAGVPSFDRELALTQITAAVPLLHTEATEGSPICQSDEGDWAATEDILSTYAGLSPADSLDAYYTNDYIK
ncbi:ABC transporter substrate-binding protein [Herbiconiux sp. KACC 21604]|uniref:ABC transporter substrate-binding protein n=1 Tax=unclassified Herbiconiux TaxID=2618217 RepID=UPI001491348A|nr:ABC transporter substrate-binding protein [Herbiconiux sp. SALV-R1]QJU52571.1 ABC transporter substrate-binding protein [Herbiconiux sp. SALV-R1]WPO87453.1 ABC transporter substrate-binding protein [Herbiconiux sp. KACC 21604]